MGKWKKKPTNAASGKRGSRDRRGNSCGICFIFIMRKKGGKGHFDAALGTS